MSTEKTETINKITMKAVGAQPKAGTVEAPHMLLHVLGIARSFKTGSSNYGFFQKFSGDFEAINLETGEVFRSNNLMLPAVAEMLLKSALIDAGAEAGRAGDRGIPDREGKAATVPVEFAYAIGVKPGKPREGAQESYAGYEYTVESLTTSKRSDALQSLRKVSLTAREAMKAKGAPGKTKTA
jgi:hypothetical protein